jgi:RNA polymerase sigma factor (sigma-70 family)
VSPLRPDQVVPEELPRSRHVFPFSSYETQNFYDRHTEASDQEGPIGDLEGLVSWLDGYLPTPPPVTVVQAVMEAAPGDEPRTSIEELMPLREVLVNVLETLTPREQRIVDLFVVQGLSIRKAAYELGMAKSHVHRLREQVFERLRDELSQQPLVQERLRP